MHKYLLSGLIVFCFSFNIYAAQEMVPPQALKNPFNVITDGCIKAIAGHLNAEARGCLRACDRRLSVAAWPSEKVFNIEMEKFPDETIEQYRQKVLEGLHQLSQSIQRVKANNDIILHVPATAQGALHEELAQIKNLTGLFMEYRLCSNSFYQQAEWINHKNVLMMLPNLKLLSLPWGHNQESSSAIFDHLKKLQSLQVEAFKLTAEDFVSMSSSITELRLRSCTIWGIPPMEKFTSLRSLSLVETDCYQTVWELFWGRRRQIDKAIPGGLEKLLSPLAPFLEKLDLACIGFDELPACLAAFENLQELDISQNDLSPDALTCLIGLKNLRWVNLAGNRECESQKDLVRQMFPPTVTISYEYTYGAVGLGQ